MKIFSMKCNGIIGDNLSIRVKVGNGQLNILKSKIIKTGTILTTNKKIFQGEELPKELYLTARQTTKTKNSFANKM